MQFLSRFLKRQINAALVRRALNKHRKVSRKAILEAQVLLEEALGRDWQRTSREAAAGLVLIRLAKDAALEDYLNDLGWDLVLTAVGDHSRLVTQISLRAMADIHAWQSARLDLLLAKAA
jgi:hypothetical protein